MLLCLAPMDGITDCPYRIITKKVFDRYNSTDDFWMFTEFMNADGYIINPSKLVRHIVKTDFERPITAQIYGGNPDMLVKCAIDIDQKYDYDAIELNIGCPSPTVMRCGGGAGMLRDKQHTLDVIKKIAESIHRPFSIKTRIGLTEHDREEQFQFIVDASPYCQMITIHGRTYKQSHGGGVDRNFIYRVKEKVSCKVIGNGGVISYEDAIAKQGNLDGVMIGQSAIANPRIFTPHRPSTEEIFETMSEHFHLSLAYEKFFREIAKDGEKFVFPTLDQLTELSKKIGQDTHINEFRQLIEFRKYAFNYVKGLPGNKEFKIALVNSTKYSEIIDEFKKFFR